MTISKPRAVKGQTVAPFPYFGGKRHVAPLIWQRFGKVKQYIEPFFGSGAVLLGCPQPASLEVVGDVNGFLANFWRATTHQPEAVAKAADYPVSHIDLGARHVWMLEQRGRLGESLQDPHWPGDAEIAGWWLWGQCAWIGTGWCDWTGPGKPGKMAGAGIQARGKVPHVGDAGRGIQAIGQIPCLGNTGMGYHGASQSESPAGTWTSQGAAAMSSLRAMAARMGRVRVLHGDWMRTLNHHYGTNGGGTSCAVMLDPPYRSFGEVYSQRGILVADECEAWALEHGGKLRICLAGHAGDYPTLDAAGWDVVPWQRIRFTQGSTKTRNAECLWFSPACLPGVGA